MGKRKMLSQTTKETESLNPIRLKIMHADDVYSYFKYENINDIKEMWWDCKATHEALVDEVDTLGKRAEDLIQSWHFLMGLTGILKNYFEWNWVDAEPRPFKHSA